MCDYEYKVLVVTSGDLLPNAARVGEMMNDRWEKHGVEIVHGDNGFVVYTMRRVKREA